MRIARETWLLAAICIADLTTTIWFVTKHGAAEGNPLMNFYLAQGILAFIFAKFALFVGPLVILEWARRHHPRFVTHMLRLGIALYLGFYGSVVWKINAGVMAEKITSEHLATVERWTTGPVSPQELALARAQLRN